MAQCFPSFKYVEYMNEQLLDAYFDFLGGRNLGFGPGWMNMIDPITFLSNVVLRYL